MTAAPAPVEARSLSSLSQLLANPPQYPRNPTHQTLEPLVLYIVRVPGSRDLFLTPLKPPTKTSISAEAIESCLYYFHVHTDQDDTVRRSLELDRPPSERPGGLAKAISRKPVSKRCEPGQAALSDASNQCLGSEQPRRTTVSRKPIGPRAQPLRSATSAKHADTVSPDENTPLSSHSTLETRWPQEPDPSGPSPPPETTVPGSKEADPSFAVTVVRRDPTSGAQWNVATIERNGAANDAGSRRFRLEMTSPGYQKFAGGQQPRPSLSHALLGKSGSKPPAGNGGHAPSVNQKTESVAPSRYFTSEVMADASTGSRGRKSSLSRLGSPSELSKMAKPPSDVQPRLIFASPWQGTCVFSIGIDGHSLRCRHHLPAVANSNSAVEPRDTSAAVAEVRFNLPWGGIRNHQVHTPSAPTREKPQRPICWSQLGDEARHGLHKSMARLRQEIRSSQTSSLPASVPGPPSDQSSSSGLGVSSFPAPAHPPASTPSPPSPPNHTGLTLGREDAGGGRKGTSAKLGKLVLHDEGLKMADLVVAASMAVWWGSWEGV